MFNITPTEYNIILALLIGLVVLDVLSGNTLGAILIGFGFLFGRYMRDK